MDIRTQKTETRLLRLTPDKNQFNTEQRPITETLKLLEENIRKLLEWRAQAKTF